MSIVLFLDVQRAAQAVSMSPRWVRAQIAAGLPCIRTEGKILIAPEDIRKWMEAKYREKPVDLAAAFRIANQLTEERGRKKRGRN